MPQISVRSLIESGSKENKFSKLILSSKFLENLLDNFLHFNQINDFLNRTENWSGIEFIEELFDYLDFSFTTSHKDKLNIPSEGRLIVVANHPLGGLDALSLICSIFEVRQDIKILANNLLTNIEQLNEYIIPIEMSSKDISRNSVVQIHNSTNEEKVLIIFPAGEVSRFRSGKVSDSDWSKSTISLSKRYNAPILPIFIEGHNSFFFYLISKFNKNLSTALLPREIFKKAGKRIILKIGNTIPASAFSPYMKEKKLIKFLKKHTYRLNTEKKGIFITEQNIIHPLAQKTIKNELNKSEVILDIDFNNKLYLTSYLNSKSVINEISRLRELTYRRVGEGTGKKSDKDYYDKICDHLVLWNNENLEIIGSYRLGDLSNIIPTYGYDKIYNSQLYEFSNEFKNILPKTLELGRSFIQQKYWRTNALDYLWRGIGEYIIKKPHLTFLFGAVSLSDKYSELAKNLIIYYYKKWYSDFGNDYVKSNNSYRISIVSQKTVSIVINANDYKTDFLNLKKALSELGYTVPILLRKYTDICEYGGVKFLEFAIDPSFSNSIDCIILMDLNTIKPEFKERYFNIKKLNLI